MKASNAASSEGTSLKSRRNTLSHSTEEKSATPQCSHLNVVVSDLNRTWDRIEMKELSGRIPDYPPPPTIARLQRLEKGDLIDHQDTVGRYLRSRIIDKRRNELKIHYINWDSKWDCWSDIQQERDKFREAGEISARPSVRWPHYTRGSRVIIRPRRKKGRDYRTGSEFVGQIHRLDKGSGQVQIAFVTKVPKSHRHNDDFDDPTTRNNIFEYKTNLYWTHLDNTDEILAVITDQLRELQIVYMQQTEQRMKKEDMFLEKITPVLRRMEKARMNWEKEYGLEDPLLRLQLPKVEDEKEELDWKEDTVSSDPPATHMDDDDDDQHGSPSMGGVSSSSMDHGCITNCSSEDCSEMVSKSSSSMIELSSSSERSYFSSKHLAYRTPTMEEKERELDGYLRSLYTVVENPANTPETGNITRLAKIAGVPVSVDWLTGLIKGKVNGPCCHHYAQRPWLTKLSPLDIALIDTFTIMGYMFLRLDGETDGDCGHRKQNGGRKEGPALCYCQESTMMDDENDDSNEEDDREPECHSDDESSSEDANVFDEEADSAVVLGLDEDDESNENGMIGIMDDDSDDHSDDDDVVIVDSEDEIESDVMSTVNHSKRRSRIRKKKRSSMKSKRKRKKHKNGRKRGMQFALVPRHIISSYSEHIRTLAEGLPFLQPVPLSRCTPAAFECLKRVSYGLPMVFDDALIAYQTMIAAEYLQFSAVVRHYCRDAMKNLLFHKPNAGKVIQFARKVLSSQLRVDSAIISNDRKSNTSGANMMDGPMDGRNGRKNRVSEEYDFMSDDELALEALFALPPKRIVRDKRWNPYDFPLSCLDRYLQFVIVRKICHFVPYGNGRSDDGVHPAAHTGSHNPSSTSHRMWGCIDARMDEYLWILIAAWAAPHCTLYDPSKGPPPSDSQSSSAMDAGRAASVQSSPVFSENAVFDPTSSSLVLLSPSKRDDVAMPSPRFLMCLADFKDRVQSKQLDLFRDAHADCESLSVWRHNVRPLLNLIDFTAMSSPFYRQSVAPFDIHTDKQRVHIFEEMLRLSEMDRRLEMARDVGTAADADHGNDAQLHPPNHRAFRNVRFNRPSLRRGRGDPAIAGSILRTRPRRVNRNGTVMRPRMQTLGMPPNVRRGGPMIYRTPTNNGGASVTTMNGNGISSSGSNSSNSLFGPMSSWMSAMQERLLGLRNFIWNTGEESGQVMMDSQSSEDGITAMFNLTPEDNIERVNRAVVRNAIENGYDESRFIPKLCQTAEKMLAGSKSSWIADETDDDASMVLSQNTLDNDSFTAIEVSESVTVDDSSSALSQARAIRSGSHNGSSSSSSSSSSMNTNHSGNGNNAEMKDVKNEDEEEEEDDDDDAPGLDDFLTYFKHDAKMASFVDQWETEMKERKKKKRRKRKLDESQGTDDLNSASEVRMEESNNSNRNKDGSVKSGDDSAEDTSQSKSSVIDGNVLRSSDVPILKKRQRKK